MVASAGVPSDTYRLQTIPYIFDTLGFLLYKRITTGLRPQARRAPYFLRRGT
jgi:hypothetical protein